MRRTQKCSALQPLTRALVIWVTCLFLVRLVVEINIFPVKVQGAWISQGVLLLMKTSSSWTSRAPGCSNSTYSLRDEEDSCSSDRIFHGTYPSHRSRGESRRPQTFACSPPSRRCSFHLWYEGPPHRLLYECSPGLHQGHVQYSVMGIQSCTSWCIWDRREQLCALRWTQWLAPAGLRGSIKLEAYHQSRQPFPLMLWDFGSLYQGVAASFWPAVAAAAVYICEDVAASLMPAVAAAANAASATLRRQNVSAVAAQTAILHLPSRGQDRVR